MRSQEPALTALRRYAEARNAARSEDLLFMLETGESLTGAAERLGLTTKALEKWLERRKMFDELRVLRSRDPITDFDFDKSASGRINAGKRYGWAS